MKLTTLEIKGFKSFADKTVLHFNESITGVVGPNGCGKSNIVDAIRWVLGEQKPTAIRTEKMENLIFNGTKARKASGMAEVSLTFENTRNLLATEYSTITISRHYFKTGNSEYRINNVPCRLKDIITLFMDTGISTDSYAIIELGMLGDILHNKDNSRRRLFEQAAGISKYKIRKRETINKLTATQQDLDRAEDILFEIETNLKELEKQAKKAQRYLRLKADYKANSIDLAILMLQSHKDIYKQLANQQTFESDTKLAIETEINALEASIADKKTALLAQEQALANQQKELNLLLDEIRKKENDSNLGKERIKFLEEKQENLKRSIGETEQNIENHKAQITALEQQAAVENDALMSIKQSLQQYLQALEQVRTEHGGAKTQLETSQQAFKAAEALLYETDKKIAMNRVRLESYQRELAQLDTDKADNAGKLPSMEQELAEREREFAEARQALENLLQNENALKTRADKLNSEIQEINTTLADIHRRLDAKRNEYTLSKNLYESFEGFPESIKYLKCNVASMQQSPLLSDIVNANETYKAALESYLEPWLNYYIVRDMQHAMEAVHALSENKKGRAHFFLLDQFTETQAHPFQMDGVTHALDVVAADPQYSALLQHLLGHVVIVSDDGDFVAKARAITAQHPGTHVLHVSGQVISSGKTVTGGSVGVTKGNRLGREKNLKAMEAAIAQIAEEESKVNAALLEAKNNLRSLQQSFNEKDIQKAREAVNQANGQIVSMQTRIENVLQLQKQVAEKQANFYAMIEQTEAESLVLNASHDTHLADKNASQQNVLEMESAFREVSERLNMHSNNYNQENIRYHQQQNKYQSVDQELQYKKNRLAENENLLGANTKQLADVIDELSEQHTGLKETGELLVQLYAQKSADETVLNTAEQDYYTARGEIAETENAIKALQRKKENSDQILGSIKDRLNELKVQLAATKERLWVEFQVELESILDNTPPENLTMEELQSKVDAAKRRIENYGEVNPMAVQAYDEMKQRYDFMQAQREDLIQAKTSLLETIQEIDETARKKFDDAFHLIRTNFIEVFRNLFTPDDDCDLILKENSDPLEAEIDIIAKPKGKKPQVIDQLSGGEKTLTAMALLFALYLIKPAPFCILDEVDAPLDDTNIAKFNNMIRKFSDNSQFIIVTHNKRTMSEVDVIYGVTMPEQGISKVVPVDFRNLN